MSRVKKAGKWGYIDKTGKEVIPLIYDIMGNFSEGLASATWNGGKGFMDKEGYFIGRGFVKKVSGFK
jgi:hypothetical protein